MNSCGHQNSTASENIELIISSVYGLISIVLYTYLIAIIVRKSKFRHPFFYQFVFLSITNILLWLTAFFMNRLVPHPSLCPFLYSAFGAPSILLKIITLPYNLGIPIQLFTVIVLSINRMTVVVAPITAHKFWSNCIPHTLIGIVVLGVLYAFYTYALPTKLEFLVNGILTTKMDDGWPHIPTAIPPMALSLLCLVTMIGCAIVSLIFLYKSKITRSKKAEVNLFWTNLGFGVTTSFLAIYMILIYYAKYMAEDEKLRAQVVSFRGYVFDVNCLVPSWLLLATNRRIRNEAFWKKESHTSVSFSNQNSGMKITVTKILSKNKV